METRGLKTLPEGRGSGCSRTMVEGGAAESGVVEARIPTVPAPEKQIFSVFRANRFDPHGEGAPAVEPVFRKPTAGKFSPVVPVPPFRRAPLSAVPAGRRSLPKRVFPAVAA